MILSDAVVEGRERGGNMKTGATQYRFTLFVAGIVTAVIGFAALLGWILDLPWLASLGENLLPMAPSTAVLFILYGIAICLRTRTPLTRRTLGIIIAVTCLGAAVALLLLTLDCLDIRWSAEHLGLDITGSVGGAYKGHMSPVTALGFLLASLSLLISS